MPTRTLLIALVIALITVMPAHAARQALVIGNDDDASVPQSVKSLYEPQKQQSPVL